MSKDIDENTDIQANLEFATKQIDTILNHIRETKRTHLSDMRIL